MRMKTKVLFVCIHNSARSQMAEAWLNHLCGDSFDAQSAGLEPGTLNPLVVESMAAVGIDISRRKTKSVSGFLAAGARFDHVITVCDETSAERCPVFPGVAKRAHLSFPDPSQLSGSKEEKLRRIAVIRDDIRQRIEEWCQELRRAERASRLKER
ncbi:MAG: arsenate reductase ArsC [Verrucomicrobia bacterium]|nr:arsenate reductase ArsC [Verrucomicrobiota bacterium]